MRAPRVVLLAVLVSFASPAFADELSPCEWLVADDFAAAGLSLGKAKPESSPKGPGCTWDPVLGKGGFLSVRVTSPKDFERRKSKATKATALEGLGDEAILYKALTGWGLLLRKGGTCVIIDGNAQLTKEKLEPLAKAVAAKLP